MLRIDIHRYDHADRVILGYLQRLLKEIKTLADKFDVLVEEVAAEKTVVDGVVTLLNRLDEQLADAKDDPAQIEAIRAGLSEQRQRLADAIVAGTPVESPPVGGVQAVKAESAKAPAPSKPHKG